MSRLTHLKARQIFDSRGNPTILVEGQMGSYYATASVPSGASTGSHEAKELRDKDADMWAGKGVGKAVTSVNDIIGPALIGAKLLDLESTDKIMLTLDGTSDKSRLGANALLGTSMVIARLLAQDEHLPLYSYLRSLSPTFTPTQTNHPQLLVNLINGGAHAPGSTTIQEFHILPRTGDLIRDLNLVHRFQTALHNHLREKKQLSGLGDEGGFVLAGLSSAETLDLLHTIKAQLHLGSSLVFGVDIAAESFYTDNHYTIDGQRRKPAQYYEHIKGLAQQYHLALIEDPGNEEDFAGFARLKKQLPETLLIGDDLTVTNPNRLKKAIAEKSVSGLIIKPNQIGTISETLQVVQLAKQHGLHTIASHRSGETNDDFIIDLGIGTGCYGLKIGALQRGERIAKYNRLLEIYES